MSPFRHAFRFLAAAVLLVAPGQPFADDDPLPDPDGKPADMRKPVQAYVLLGQSNMLGFGRVRGARDRSSTRSGRRVSTPTSSTTRGSGPYAETSATRA